MAVLCNFLFDFSRQRAGARRQQSLYDSHKWVPRSRGGHLSALRATCPPVPSLIPPFFLPLCRAEPLFTLRNPDLLSTRAIDSRVHRRCFSATCTCSYSSFSLLSFPHIKPRCAVIKCIPDILTYAYEYVQSVFFRFFTCFTDLIYL